MNRQHRHLKGLHFLFFLHISSAVMMTVTFVVDCVRRSVKPLPVSVFTCASYAEARNRYRLDVCPSVRLSVRLSHAGTVSKRLNILS